ncbi:MAG: FG-GAP-like repeat-containing protein [Candidatus Eisenbacteria bacterium]|nr:FG-GAP-like repeat-containing protein [Candidatus Eisenbacteria bacterium]
MPARLLLFLLLVLLAIPGGLASGSRPDGLPIPRTPLEEMRADTNDVIDRIADTTLTVTVGGHPLEVPYFATGRLDEPHPEATRAILVLHGTLRNASEYFWAVVHGGEMSDKIDSTFVIAPQFLVEGDIAEHNLPNDYAYWLYYGWRQGDESWSTADHPRPAHISSFAVADSILMRIVQNMPNVRQIIVTGHSAGGQFSNLYTAGNQVHPVIEGSYGIPIRYIVSNPSCYIYFDDERWIPGTNWEFAVPDSATVADCPDYNHYKYGLIDPNPYMSLGDSTLATQYSSRRVVYLLGGADTNPNDTYLDKSCPAELEGAYRLERGIVYTEHLKKVFGDAILDSLHQTLAVVPGIGHNHSAMFNSTCGLFYIYDYGECNPVPPLPNWQDVTTSVLASIQMNAGAWGDYDGDGFDDLVLSGVWGVNVIRNRGPMGGGFVNGTLPPMDDPFHAVSATWGDYDGDGWRDLFVATWREPSRLYRNQGDGTFADTQLFSSSGDQTQAAWADYDNDGDLDLYLARTNDDGNRLFRNDGADGFTDVADTPVRYRGSCRDAVWGDYDGDGDADLYVTALGPNHLFRNDGASGFTDVTSGPLGDDGNGSGAAWGDADNDGDLDLYLANRTSRNHLFRNDGGDVFTDVTDDPLGDEGSTRSVTWGDYDNDGWLDLYLVESDGANKLLHNSGDGTFTDASEAPINDRGMGYSGSFSDYDRDGDLDLYVANNNGMNRLFRNDLASAGNPSLEIVLRGVVSNRDAIGAVVRIYADGKAQMREVGTGSGFLSQNSRIVHFGLGKATIVDSVVVRWPSGIVQRRAGVGINQTLALNEDDSPAGGEDLPGGRAPGRLIVSVAPNPSESEAGAVLTYRLRAAAPVTIGVYDPSGRRIARLRDAAVEPAGLGRVAWDGRDDAGRPVASGIYYMQIETAGGARETAPVVRLR